MPNALWGALLAATCAPVLAAALSFTSPGCGQTVSGTIPLTVDASFGSPARVEFAMGSHRIGSAVYPAFSLSWNSASVMDGMSAIQARGFDALGNLVSSTECIVTVSNRQASLMVTAPDLTQPLSGKTQLLVTGTDAVAFPAVWTLNIDGEEQSTIWTDNSWKTPLNVVFTLDTTRFSNGAHELQISMNSRTGPAQPQWVNWRGMVNRVIQFSNGRAPMDIVTQLSTVHLEPGRTALVGCRQLFTDGSSGVCGSVSYQSSDESIATVDAGGSVTARNSGFAQVTVSAGDRSSSAGVWVSSDARIPHFEGDGTITREFQPGKSLFVVAPFFLDPVSINANAGMLDEALKAGINTLGFGVYLNPRNTTAAFTDWKASFDQTVAQQMKWGKDNGFHLLLTGDDIFRNIGSDAWFTLNWQYGKPAVEYAMGALSATGVGIGIEAIDEASSIWGDRPVPEGRIGQADYLFDRLDCTAGTCSVHWPSSPVPGGWDFAFRGSAMPGLNTRPGSLFTAEAASGSGFSFSAAGPVTGTITPATDPGLEFEWFAGKYCTGGTVCSPAVPNGALATMRGWMTEAQTHTPIAFPPLAISSPAVHGAWMGPGSVSDYASNYFSSLKTRTTYPWSEGIQEMVTSMVGAFYSRQPYLMLDRPQLMLVSLAGPSYTKRNAGGSTYLPGVDSLDQPGVSPEHVSALMMTGAALGGAGLRLYYFEPPSDLSVRSQAAGGSYLQTGSNPVNLQSNSWRAMSYSANLLTRVLEPYLLGAATHSPAFGRNIVSAVRQGADGMMLLIVNGNDWARKVPVSFGSYPHEFGTARYRLQASEIRTDLLPASQAGEEITLEAGESVAYVFPSSLESVPLKDITVAPQQTDGAVRGVRFGYVYSDDVLRHAAITCAKSCHVAQDPRLGKLFYTFVGENPDQKTAIHSTP